MSNAELPERIYTHPTSAEWHPNRWPLEQAEYTEYVRVDLASSAAVPSGDLKAQALSLWKVVTAISGWPHNKPLTDLVDALNGVIEVSAPSEDGALALPLPSSNAWREWFDQLGDKATASIVNATANLVTNERLDALQTAGVLPSDDPPNVGKFLATIADGLRHAIRDHGPITSEWIGSAAKRVWGRVKGTKYNPFRVVKGSEDGAVAAAINDAATEICDWCGIDQTDAEKVAAIIAKHCAATSAAPSAASGGSQRCGECDEVIEGSHFCFICIGILKENLSLIPPLGYEHAITLGWSGHNERRHELIAGKRSRLLSESEITELAELQWLAGIKRELANGPSPVTPEEPNA